MRGKGGMEDGEKDLIMYCTVQDVVKGFCLAEISITNSGLVCLDLCSCLPLWRYNGNRYSEQFHQLLMQLLTMESRSSHAEAAGI